jgi:hypothetical protein
MVRVWRRFWAWCFYQGLSALASRPRGGGSSALACSPAWNSARFGVAPPAPKARTDSPGRWRTHATMHRGWNTGAEYWARLPKATGGGRVRPPMARESEKSGKESGRLPNPAPLVEFSSTVRWLARALHGHGSGGLAAGPHPGEASTAPQLPVESAAAHAQLLSPESSESGTWSTRAKQGRDPRTASGLLTLIGNRNSEEGGRDRDDR